MLSNTLTINVLVRPPVFEPGLSAWQAEIVPLDHVRYASLKYHFTDINLLSYKRYKKILTIIKIGTYLFVNINP